MLVYTITKGTNKSFVYDIYHGIQGEKGDQGIQGEQGIQGVPGTAATIQVGSVTSGNAPSVINSGTSTAAILDFVLEKGDTGEQGPVGQAAGFGTPTASATALPVGSEPTASVVASGDATQKVFAFSFGIPAGGDENVQADWNETDTSADDYIKNKPTIPVVATAIASGDTGYTTGDQVYTALQTAGNDIWSCENCVLMQDDSLLIDTIKKNNSTAPNMNVKIRIGQQYLAGGGSAPWYQGSINSGQISISNVKTSLNSNCIGALVNVYDKDWKYLFSAPLFKMKEATSISSGETGFVNGDQVYTALQSAGNDVWEIYKPQILWVGSNYLYMAARIYKNGALYSGSFRYKLVIGTEEAQWNTTLSDGLLLNSSISIASPHASSMISLEILDPSDATKFLWSETFPLPAYAIQAQDQGYVTGNQVYQVVGNVETLLAAL